MSWGIVQLPAQRALVYSYVDPQAGPSAKGALVRSETPTLDDARDAATRPNITVRLGPGLTPRALTEEELDDLQLPDEPQWLEFFRPREEGPWRKDPLLAGRFHPQHPNDLQVSFFLPAHRQVEQMWVRLDREVPSLGAWGGTLLNTSHLDPTLTQGTRVDVRGAKGAKAPLWVSAVMAKNLERWDAVCSACGFDLVLEPVEALLARQFPGMPEGSVMEVFTTRCAMCNQTQSVALRRDTATLEEPGRADSRTAARIALIVVAMLGALSFVAWELLK